MLYLLWLIVTCSAIYYLIDPFKSPYESAESAAKAYMDAIKNG
jgi:hypothetical protein